MTRKIIYLDNGATTPVYANAAKEMEKYLLKEYGNPSSPHALGENAQEAIKKSKEILAREINCKAWEMVFTSGGTEANNLALLGIAKANPNKKKIIISVIEHSSIYETCLRLKKEGYDVIEIPVNRDGIIDLEKLEKEIDSDTLLVSIMHVNNEIGVIQDLHAVGKVCRKKGILFHTDAVQSFGKIRINVKEMNIDLLTASAHKIGGPKGIGFLYIKEGLDLEPLIIGGGQESGKRGGTENVPGIAGFSKALEITKKVDKEKIRRLRDYFIGELVKIGGKVNGSLEKRIYNNINVSFDGKDGEMLVIGLSQKGIMCSTKSACLEKQKKENRVLKALGLGEKEINGTLRLALNEFITRRDVDYVVKEIKKLISR